MERVPCSGRGLETKTPMKRKRETLHNAPFLTDMLRKSNHKTNVNTDIWQLWQHLFPRSQWERRQIKINIQCVATNWVIFWPSWICDGAIRRRECSVYPRKIFQHSIQNNLQHMTICRRLQNMEAPPRIWKTWSNFKIQFFLEHKEMR